MPANIIGHVVHIKGSVEVRAVDGTIKLLSLGDAVHEGEVVTTTAAAEVFIDFLNGRRLELAESSEALLDESVHRAQEFGNEQLFAEIAQVQQALLDGTLDINSLEPTAAGPELPAASAASGLGAGAVYTREGREGEVDSRSTAFDGSGLSGPGLADLGSDALAPQTFTEDPTGTASTTADSPSVVLGHWIGSLAEGNPGDLFSATGTLSIFDPDPADTPSFAGGTFAGAFGDLTLTGTSWSYTLDQSRVQELDAGDIINDVITMTASDGTTQDITITIAGTDDAPIVFGAFTGALSEGDLGDVVSATGTLGISDIDDDDSPEFANTVVAGTYGSLSLVGGNWTYLLNQPAVQGLGAGDVVTDTITLTASDGTVQNIVLTVSGTDDAPVVSGVFTGTVDEGDLGDVVTATGTLSISDVDSGDNPVFADTTVTGSYGALALTGGAWTYTLNQATAQSLDDGDVVTDTLMLTASDGTVQTITITVNGTEDAPVVSGVFTGTVAEGDLGDVVTATGSIAISDVDAGDNPEFTDTAVAGTYGTLALVGGEWTYTVNQAAVQSLGGSDIATDIITLTATDGTTQNITITITGSDDSLSISGVDTGATAEDSVFSAGGALVATGANAGPAPTFTPQSGTSGTYGTFSIDASGNWSYALDNVAAQVLDDGDIASESFVVTATSADGDTATKVVTVTVAGQEDAPVVAGTYTGTVAEGDIGDVVTATGTLSISDVDSGDNPSFADTTVNGAYGALVLIGGNWTYTLDQATAQALDDGDVVTDTLTLTASDGTVQNITVTVNGTEDAPVVAGTFSGTVAEGDIGDVVTTIGTIAISDVDGDDNPSFADTTVNGAYGSLALVGGDWTYTLDQAAAQSLDNGDVVTETLTLTASDGTLQNITITVNGTEDAPVVAGTFTGTVDEGDIGDVVTATGTIAISDVDAGDNPSFADTTVNGTYGSLDLVGGDWTYTLDQAAAQSLDDGDVVTDTLTLTASDGTLQNITITVNGTEDAPVVAGTFSGTVAEGDVGDVVTATGTLSISDVDTGDNPSFTDTTVNGAYGSLDLVGGDWTYTLDQATAQSLDDGDVVTDTLTLTASDGTLQIITITVNGTEDAPLVSGTFSGTVAEGDIGDVVTAAGSLSISDVDSSDNPSFADTTVNGAYGSLALVSGDWTYTLNQTTAQSLDDGDTITDTLTLTASDGTIQNITITVNGTEDAPVVAGTFSSTVAEGDIGDVVTTTGTIAISDVDSGDNPSFADTTVNGAYGSLDLVGGDWTYTLDQAAAQSLDDGDVVTDTLTLTASDGTIQNITITVNGTEDAPVVAGTFTGTVDEGDVGDVVTATGTLSISDVDTGDNPSFTDTTVNGAYGSLDLVGGDWTYTLDQATAQSLDDGDVVTDTLTLTASDGTLQIITITVNGTEDAPLVSGTFSGTVAEGDIGDVVTAAGSLSISDVDSSDNPSFADTTVNGAYGSLALVSGDWTYTLNQTTAQSLDDGDTITDTLTLTASDGTIQNITITVNGTEDAPVVAGTFSSTVAEGDIGDVVTTTGTIAISDVDSGDNPSFADTTVNGAYGSLDLVGGDWTYTLDQAAAQSLDDGDVVTDTLTLTASDGTIQNITITVNGTEDAPVVAGTFTGTVDEGDIGDVVTATGTLSISDVDTGDNPSFADTTVNGAYGSLDLVGGDWTYTLDQATAQALDDGDTVTDTLTLTASDGTLQNITITVNGTEDAPVVAGTFSGTVAEGDVGDVVTATGTLSISDVDTGDNPSFADTTVNGAYGSLELVGGDWTYTLDQAAAQSLDDGDTVTDTLTLTASDGTVQSITITVNGTEDAPVVSGTFTGTVAESDIGDVVTATGTIAISDVDGDDNPSFADTTVNGAYGSLALVGGDWTYLLNQPAVQSLGAGDVVTDTITLTASDGTVQNIVLTVSGTDDAPVVSGVFTGTVDEGDLGDVVAATGTLSISDVDSGDNPVFADTTVTGSYGALALTGGAWTYTLNQATAQSLDDGDVVTDTLMLTASDGTVQTITITVNGTEDAPVVSGVFTGTVAEGDLGDVVTATGSIAISDVDAGDNPEFTDTAVAGTYGTLALVGGEWTYTVNQAAVQSLGGSDIATDIITLTATDGTTQNITITITGSDDSLSISGVDTGATAEDSVFSAGGALVATDADAGPAPTFTPQSGTPGTYGTFSIDASGNWSYALDNVAAQVLDDGDIASESFVVTATSADGDTATKIVTVTVAGQEDAPVVAGTYTGTVAEGDIGDVVTATGTIAISDVDGDDNPSFADTTVNGAYGSLALVGGDWTYTLDQAAAQSLDDGDTVTDTLTLTASDGTIQNITITVNGTEDAPVVAGTFSGAVDEGDVGDVVTATGTIAISDVDGDDNPSFADTTVNGAYGSLALVGGDWTYTLDQAATQSLDDGDVVTDTLTLTASDGTVQNITITLNGTEDAPVVAGTFTGTVAEGDIGDVVTATGTIAISDVDGDDNPSFADTTVNGAYGSLALVGGDWTYTLDQATAQSLDDGDVVTDTLTLTASDGTLQNITITVNGTEDVPVVAGTFTGTVAEGDIGDVVTATGTIAISDVDTGDNPSFADTTVNGAYGSLDLVGGDWTYTLDQAAAQSLDDGDVVTDTLTLTASDGTEQNITITVNGTEDAPVVAGTFSGTVDEGDVGDVVTATGTIAISDVDGDDNPSFADTTVNGAYGSLALVGGDWTYTLDQAAAQSLDDGDVVTDTLTLTASDGTVQNITITVNGTEDAPVVAGTFSGTVDEGDIGDVVTATGTLSISDVDSGDNPSFADTTVNGAYGSLDLVGGNWTYTLDQAAAQSLDDGDVVTDTLTLTASDGTIQNITITVNGTEDAPVVAGTFSGAVDEGDVGDVVTATGTIAISDVDGDDNPSFADTTVNGAYGSLALVGGDWTYTLDQATAQSLDDGDVVADTLTLTASDGTIQNITITVNGTEDEPVVAGTFSGTVAEGDIGDVVTATGTIAISDVDGDDNPSFADTTVNGAYGSLALVGGNWTYTLDQATAQSLDDGDVVIDTLTLTASDGTIQNITITVNGTEDAPVVSGTFTGTVAEGDIGDVVTATGTIAISDVDGDDNPSFADTTVNGAYGSLALVGGDWTYTLDQAAAQSLDDGDVVTDTLTLTASDGTVQNITITVNGTEDAPVVSGTFSGTVAEGDVGDVVTAIGTIAISDVDGDDNPSFADTTVNGAYGSLDLVGGDWTYTLDQATAQSLDDGDVVTDTLTLTASDGTIQNITITVNGTEDAPVVSGTFSGTVAEGDVGDVVTATGTIAISDVDGDDNPSFADTTVNGAYGSLALVGGNWTYTLDQAAAQALDDGDVVTDTLTLTASDGTIQNITITVNGTEDAPVVAGTFTGTVAEGDIGDVVTATGTIAISDVDGDDNPSFADTTVNGAYGSLALVGGNWTYTLDQAAAQALDDGDVVTDTLTLTASDGTIQNITITVNGTEDAPVVAGTFTGTVAEGDIGDVVTATGTIAISDVDTGDNPSFADTTVNGAYGSLDLVGGDWTYTLDQATAQSLDDGDVVTDTLTLTASDGTIQNITITVNGTEDAPVVSGTFSGTVAESDIGDVVTATGTIAISDVDGDDNPSFADTTVNGAYGSLALVGGDWTYTLDQATAQSLDDGDVVTDTLTLTASDGTLQNITITVNGTEDAPVVAGTFTGTVAESDIGDVVTATGTIAISDVDGDDNPNFADTTVNGAYGSLALVGGDWTYTLDQATAQSLDDGDTVTDTLTLTASDGTVQSITITVNGTEDAPVVSGTFTGTVAEGDIGDVVTATGTIAISDVDGDDNPSFADTTVNGAYGSLALVGGDWTYTLDQATAQSLDDGDVVADTLTLTASDGTIQNITITVNGTEDEPVVAGTFSGTVAEGDIGDVVAATGTLSISDVDGDDNPSFADTTVNGAYGSLDLVGGDWTYTLDQAAAQSLDNGDVVTDTLTLTASDGTLQNITITVNGTEDAPVVAGTFSGTVAEGDIGDVVTATGTLSISDVDTGDNPSFADTTVNGAYGSLDLVGGDWTYTLDQATAQSLDDGDTVTDTLTLTASDGTLQNITITVNGTEDAPVVAGTFSGTVAEGDIGDVVTATGTIAISDMDGDDNPSFADTTVNGAYGSLDLMGGDWTYMLDQAAAQSLDDGDAVTDTLTLTASDGTLQNITITVNGTEDAPVVSGTFTGTVAEGNIGDVVNATGTLSIGDVDGDDNPSFADTTVNGAYGSLALVGGDWTYTLDQATAQSLDDGDVVTDTLMLTASDGTVQTITITVNGTEDAPVVSGVFTGTVAEGDLGDVVTATGSIAISDVDAGDNPEFTDTAVAGTYGTLALVGGDWTYTVNQAAVQSLGGSDVATDIITLTATDGTTQNITITISGSDDSLSISGVDTGATAEDSVFSAGGALVATDADAGPAPTFTPQSGTPGTYGTFSIDASGNWSYALDNVAAQVLDDGDIASESFVVTATSADGDTATKIVTVTVAGQEDAPVVAGTYTGTVAEGDIGDVVTATGTIAISDVDGDDNPSFADTTVNGAYGSLALVGGNWTYTLDQAAAQALDDGDVVTDTLTLTASDGTIQNITITVNGTEDAPVVAGTFTGTVAEGDIGDVVTATGTIAISDVDGDDNPSFADTTVNGAYGSLDLVGGDWTYTLDQAAAQSLDDGDVVTDTLTLTASDGTVQNITITVNGTEDAPVVSGTFSGTVAEGDVGDVVTATGTIAISDVDGDDNPSFADTTVNGAYGSLDLVGGDWTYTLDQATAQSLDDGDVVTDTLTLTASDGTLQNITITVNGTEDAPVVAGTFTGTVAEGDIGDVVTATGTIAISDVDTGDNPSFADTTVNGIYGSLALVGGDWTYTLDQAAAQSLDDGDVVTDTLTLTASDGTIQNITITVNGTEDAPVVAGTFTGTVAEGDVGDVVTATGTIAISDVDDDDNPSFADTTVNGAYGSLALVGGNWTYTLDQATAQSLDDGDVVTDTLTLTASDGTIQNITITVNGTEDAPVVSGTFSGTVAESDIGDVVTATGTIAISDVDGDDNPSFADTTVNGAYGSLALVGGDWTYTLDQATAQSLDDGDTVTDTLTLTASDGTVQSITITVNGTEDAPVVAGTFTGTVAEGDIGDVVTATGTIAISDVDGDDNPSFADTTVNGAYGSLALVGGDWTYTLDQATAQSLDDGDVVIDTLTLTASDGTIQNITITVNGTEDAPVVSGTFTGTVAEGDIGDVVTATGTIAISDVDGDDNPSFADTTVNGAYGSLDLVGGDWTYTLDQAAAQSLDDGDVVTDTLTLTASDGTVQNITITVNGTEDAPVVAGTFSGTVDEGDIGDVVTATGTLSISDVDSGDNPSFADTTVNGAYGSLALVGGDWTYTLDQATAQSLDDGDVVTDTLTLTASDGTVQNITITVNGTEDAPVVAGTFSGTVAEGDLGDVVTATGTIAISDADDDDNPSFADTTVNGAYGSLALVGGDWTYTLDQATAQSLDDGDVVTDTLTLTASDGTEQNITITVNGTEDASVVSGTFSGTVYEGDIGDVVTATGTLSISDVDSGDNPSFADTTVNGPYGSFDLVGGNWTYTLDQATAQSLDDGDVVTDTLTLTASDGTVQNITITVNGTEDAPVVYATFSGTVDEGDIGDVVTATGTIAISDVDGDDNPIFADTTVNGAYGSLDLVGGDWTYTLDQATAQSLNDGDVVTDTLTLTASDGTTQNITITVNGTEDAPVVAGTFSGTVDEGDIGDVVTATGTLSISDVDSGDNPSFADTTVNGAYGSLNLVGGSWTYTLDQAAAQSLDDGEVATDTLTLTASDGTIQNIAITINGTEDAPVVSGTFSGTVAEGDIGDVVTATGTIAISDVDSGDNPSFADTTVNGAYGSLVLVGGNWTYTLDQATAQSLNDGDTVTDTLALTASDGTVQNITITVNGTEDASVVTGTFTGTVAEGDVGDVVTATGTIAISDVDSGDSPTFSDTTVNGSYGTLDLVGGNWTYTLDQATAQSLDDGDVVTDTLTLIASDGTVQNITITVNGTEDAPVVYATFGGTVIEGDIGDVVTATGTIAISDVDSGDNPSFTDTTVSGIYGSLDLVGGNWTYTLDQATAQSLDDGDVVTDTLALTATDGTVQTITITVNGTEDDPVVSGTFTGTVAEGDIGDVVTATGSIAISDVDSGDNPSFADTTVNGTYGSLALVGGNWTYTVDQPTVQTLTDGDVVTDTITLTATDGTTQDITVTVTGTNDAPVALASNVTTLEDTQQVFTAADFGSTDVEGDALASITIQSLESVGSLRLNGVNVVSGQTITKAQLDAGELTYDPLPDTSGSSYDSFTFTVNDADAGTASAAMTVHVTGVDDGPIGPITDVDAALNLVTSNAAVGTVVGVTAFATDPDPEDGVTYALLDDAGGRFTIDASTGVISVASALDSGGPTTFTVRDEFSSSSYNNNDGSVNWSTPWLESNDDGSASSGQVQITGGVLQLDNHDKGSLEGAMRAVDLSGASNATLSFDFGLLGGVKAEDSVVLEISSDGGANWTTLETFTGSAGATSGTRSYDVSGHATADTQIRFSIATKFEKNDRFFTVDDLQIQYDADASVGTYTVQVEATSTDGTTSTASMDINVVDSADDFAVVHESALTDGSGRVESAFDSNDEDGQNVGAGEPTKIATGNLLANDGGATSITSIDGNTPVSGTITITGSYGTLVVDAATGDYTYTLTGAADNSAAADDLAVAESFSYTTNMGTTSALNVSIIDDTPQTGDFTTNVPEGQMSEYQLVLTLDVSGSMTGAQYDGVVYLDDGTQTTRLAMAKDALKALVEEYHSQSDAVSVHLVTFSSGATVLNGGAAYTDLTQTLNAIDSMGGSGGTNYEAGLDAMISTLDANNDGGLDVTGTNLSTITYFISDGVPTSGASDPVTATGWDNFTANNGIDSFAVGIGAGITDFSALNAIHNVDGDASGTVDSAIHVPDTTKLEEELLSTVPASFGGSIVSSGAFQTIDFGADGGSITSIMLTLDTDADGTPDTDVTFSYDPGTDTITNDGGLASTSGTILPLTSATHGFVEGRLIFDFSTGDYNYFQSTSVTEGDSFTLTFTAVDSDGDGTDPTTVTVQIVDGKPVANDDTDTLFALGAQLEGNVISGEGTDGGVANGSSFTTFSSQGVGVDNAVDNARVTSIEYRGDTLNLTIPTTGSVTATATDDGSSYTYSVSAAGVLTLVNNTDSSSLDFNTDGYYRYTPSSVPSPPTTAQTSVDFTDGTTVSTFNGGGSVNGVSLSTPDGVVSFDPLGAAVDDDRLETGERLVIDFDATTYQFGVQEIVLTAASLGSSYEVFNITAYHVDGHEMGLTSVSGSTSHTLFPDLSGIARIEIQAGSNTWGLVDSISFRGVQEDTSTAAIEPEVINYTLTDTDGDSDTASLTLKAITNTYVDTDGDGLETGSSANDFLSGLDGDDLLIGGAGHDVLEGGVGDDTLEGGTGDDVLVGGDGADLLRGESGNDILEGGAGDDELQGGTGDDTLRGGEGDDLLVGGSGANTLYGGAGDDTLQGGDDGSSLYGGTGDDILTGGAGVDFLSGGAGHDILTGGAGADTFAWGDNDRGSRSSPDGDTILDFQSGPGGDVLDLGDLLQGEESNPLTDYLSISVDDYDNDGNLDTRIAVDSDGGIFFQPVLNITLDNTDLSEGGTLSDQDMLNNLITNGNLNTDL